MNKPRIDSLYSERLSRAEQTFGMSRPFIYTRALELLRGLPAFESICDLGAGSGAMLGAIHESWPNISKTGIDILPRPESLDLEIDWVSHDLEDATKVPGEQFDVVVSLEVIEHLENPRQLVREAARLVKPSGYVIMSTPNNHSVRALTSLLLRGQFADFTDYHYPKHISPIVTCDGVRMLKETGLKNVSVEYSRKGFVPSANLFWQTLCPWFKGRLFSDNVYFIGQRA